MFVDFCVLTKGTDTCSREATTTTSTLELQRHSPMAFVLRWRDGSPTEGVTNRFVVFSWLEGSGHGTATHMHGAGRSRAVPQSQAHNGRAADHDHSSPPTSRTLKPERPLTTKKHQKPCTLVMLVFGVSLGMEAFEIALVCIHPPSFECCSSWLNRLFQLPLFQSCRSVTAELWAPLPVLCSLFASFPHCLSGTAQCYAHCRGPSSARTTSAGVVHDDDFFSQKMLFLLLPLLFLLGLFMPFSTRLIWCIFNSF